MIELKEGMVIHTPSKEQFIKLNELIKNKWNYNFKDSIWENYETNTCIRIYDGHSSCGPIQKFQEGGYTITKFKDLVDNEPANTTDGDTPALDMVNHPSHYTDGKIECIDYIQDKLTDVEYRGYIKGNIIKYLTRERIKNGNEDLKKAQWYLNHYVDGLGNVSNE